MEPGGDDLQDDLVYESAASSYEGESSHLVPGISQDSEDDQAVSSSTADSESASLLAKKRKRRVKDKERKAKVRSCGEYILYTDRL